MDGGTAATGRGGRRAASALALRLYGRRLFHRPVYAVTALALPVVGTICMTYLPPLVVADLVGRLAAGTSLTAAVVAPRVFAFAAAFLLGEAVWRVGVHCMNRIEAHGLEDLYNSGLTQLLAKDTKFFEDNLAGTLTKRLLGFSAQFETFVDTVAFQIVAQVAPLGFAAVVLWRYEPSLVLILAVAMAVAGLAMIPLVRRRQLLVDTREQSWAALSGHAADTLGNMEAVRTHASELREASAHRRKMKELRQLSIRSWDFHNLRIETVVSALSALTNVAGLVLALIVAGRSGTGGTAAMVVTFSYFLQATRILFDLNPVYRQLERSVTEAAQFAELLLDRPTVVDPEEPSRVTGGRAKAVVFDDVVFTHSGSDGALFDHLALRVDDGEKVGIVGRSGAGKTSLIRLVMRLMNVDGGRILVGDQDIASVTQRDLRSLVAYVPQDPVMFHRSIRDNILFGRPDASESALLDAAARAHVLEFVERLPDGFDTPVGDRGVKLSGGQRQRVAIARALLRNAPILLLDEATSALDSDSEAHIQEALRATMKDRTTIAVAHRLSTVASMDRLIVMDRGRVVEQGPHSDLLTRGGSYARLWRRQSGGLLAAA